MTATLPVKNSRGQATTELLLVSVWFFVVVLVVVELTVTMAGGEAASYIAYMSARANTAGASPTTMAQRLTGAIPWASRVEATPDGRNPLRMKVKVPPPLVIETVGTASKSTAVSSIFSIEASAEMPGPVTGKGGGDNDLF